MYIFNTLDLPYFLNNYIDMCVQEKLQNSFLPLGQITIFETSSDTRISCGGYDNLIIPAGKHFLPKFFLYYNDIYVHQDDIQNVTLYKLSLQSNEKNLENKFKEIDLIFDFDNDCVKWFKELYFNKNVIIETIKNIDNLDNTFNTFNTFITVS